MPYKKLAKDIIVAIEIRIEKNIEKGNFAPIELTITEAELKDRMGLQKLKSVTRKRLVDTLRAEGYDVSDDGDYLSIVVDVAARDTVFDTLEDLEESVDD